MPANAEQYTRVHDTRRVISQTTIPSHFAADRSQAQRVGKREDRLTWRSLLTTQSAAGNGTLFDGAISHDLDECTDNTSPCSRRRPPPSTGLPTRFRGLSLTQSSTTIRHDSFNGTRFLKRKAEIEQERDIAPSKHTNASNIRPLRRRKTRVHQQSNYNSADTRPEPGRAPRRAPATNVEVIDLDSDTEEFSTTTSYRDDSQLIEPDDQSGEDNSDCEFQVTGAQRAAKKSKLVTVPRVLDLNKRSVRVHRIIGYLIQQRTVVEFSDGTFMRIHQIYQDDREGHLLIGYVFTRAGTFGPQMPHRRDDLQWQRTKASDDADTRLPLVYRGGELMNEVVQKVRTFIGENATDYGLWRRSIKDVIRIRDLRITNQHYDDINCLTSNHFSAASSTLATLAKVKMGGILRCRWKDVTTHNHYGKWQEQRIERPGDHECDDNWTDGSERLREAWGGRTPPITADTKLIFGDGFCGAGGVSQGAMQAGLEISFSFDHDQKKITTYRNNYPNCRSLVLDANKFIALARKKGWKVHVLHLSPPCQPYSQANVSPNVEKNERNQAPLLGCADIIKALRPRIVTVEETIGIENRFHPWFYALLHQFTELGFSVRWSKLNCADFGVPQSRQRLILIAAAPGEDLPPFPEATHPRGAVSIASALREVEKAHHESPLSHHDTSSHYPIRKRPFDQYRLAKTITCDGGLNNYHPNGLRKYTPRELAALQTFPVRYKWPVEFGVTEIRQQIGNAVPPLLAKAILESVVKSLKETDKRRLATMRSEAQKNVIDLTSDVDDEADTTLADQDSHRTSRRIRRDYEI